MLTVYTNAARRGLLTLIMVAIVGGSILGAVLNAQRTGHAIRTQLENRTATVALLLEVGDVRMLSGKASDVNASYYQRLKRTLAKVKNVNADVRSIYITVAKNDKLYFYVDSEVPETDFYSPPGEYYPDATPLFKSIFRTGKIAVEGPASDEFGTWVSGLAPIKDPRTDEIVAVLGVDIDAENYYQSLIIAAGIPILLGLIVFAALMSYEWQRLRDARALRLQSELISVASHELRTPLTGIMWASEVILTKLTGHERELAKSIRHSTANLQVAIEEILQLTRLNAGKQRDLNRTECDISEVITDACDTQSLVAQHKKLTIDIDKIFDGPIIINCDRDLIKRAIHNVLSNAIKYGKSHTAVQVQYDSDNTMHRISFTDHGIGIPAEELAKVMNGFYRASNARVSNIDGSGMGLYLVRSIMEQHGGSVDITSTEGVGTTVSLLLPKR